MTRLSLTSADPLTATADALVVAAYQGADGPVAADERFDALVSAAALAGAQRQSRARSPPFPGRAPSTADRVVVVGIGAAPTADGSAVTMSAAGTRPSGSARPPAPRPARSPAGARSFPPSRWST